MSSLTAEIGPHFDRYAGEFFSARRTSSEVRISKAAQRAASISSVGDFWSFSKYEMYVRSTSAANANAS